MAFESKRLFHEHKDLIHHVAYDHHGRRIATCSSDQSVTVWDLNQHGVWNRSSSWKALQTHGGPVWKVVWAHPEFGQVLATCSFDRSAHIWEEVVSEDGDQQRGSSTARQLQQGPVTHWKKRTALVDSRSNVTDIKFAPRHQGLMLATASAQGVVRVYEAPDIMDLSRWHLIHEIVVSRHRCSSISWSNSRFHPPLLATGCDDPQAPGPRVVIYEFNDTQRKWFKVDTLSDVIDPVSDVSFAPSVGRSFHLLAVASHSLQVFSLKPLQNTPAEADIADTVSTGRHSPKFESKELCCFDGHDGKVWRVSWNVMGTVLASAGGDGTIKLWKANYMGNWKMVLSLRPQDHGIEQDPVKPPFISPNPARYY